VGGAARQAGFARADDDEADFGNAMPDEIRERLLPGLQPF
jgi:hypothetical protein